MPASLAPALNRLQVFRAELKQEIIRVEQAKTQTLPPSVTLEIANKAAQAVTPMIRQMIIANALASGIKNHTGGLLEALNKVIVFFKSRGSKPKLVIVLPPGLDAKIYAKVNSLDSGAVRTSKSLRGGLGGKAKKTLKKQAYGELVSKKALSSLSKGLNYAGGKKRVGVDYTQIKDAGKSKEVGNYSVIKPRHFFRLSGSQEEQVASAFLSVLRQGMQDAGQN